MDEKQILAEKWKKKIEGIHSDPPIDYKLIFNETVKNIANVRYSILDVGTGAGRVVFENNLNKIYRKVVGIDINPEMVEICKGKAIGMKNVEFEVMDSTKQTAFRSATFDVISAMFPPFDPKEMYRLLTMGGYFVLLTSLRGDHKEVARLFPATGKNLGGKPFGTLKELNDEVKSAGFTIVGTDVLRYKWIFKDTEVLKQFYEKIYFSSIFNSNETILNSMRKNIDGSITVTRVLCTIVARKI
jgi:ubiquinone/menaquinone biosynthesis C-methylase UbiE